MDQIPFPLPLYLQQPGKGARGEPQVPPVDLPAANQEYLIIFAAARSASPRGIAAAAYAKNMPSAYFLNAAAWRKYLDLVALGGDTSDAASLVVGEVEGELAPPRINPRAVSRSARRKSD